MKTLETKEVERNLWKFTHQKLGVYGCFEVTMGLSMMRDHKEIVDYVTYNTKGEVTCYEIKTSYSDFKSRARKSFWGNKNYLVVNDDTYNEIFKHGDLTGGIGLYLYSGNSFTCIHGSSNHQLTVGERVTIIESMVRSMDREMNKYKHLQTVLKELNAKMAGISEDKK